MAHFLIITEAHCFLRCSSASVLAAGYVALEEMMASRWLRVPGGEDYLVLNCCRMNECVALINLGCVLCCFFLCPVIDWSIVKVVW